MYTLPGSNKEINVTGTYTQTLSPIKLIDMKKILLLFYLTLLVYNYGSSQGYLNEMKYFSSNERYSLEIKGNYYDDFYGDCQYILLSNLNDTLWVKEFIYKGAPKLSVNCTIAIPTNGKIVFTDSTGKIINEFFDGFHKKGHITQGGFCDDIWHPLTHGFSKSGDFYFVSTGTTNSDNTRIHCLTKEGKKKWETEFAEYCPDNINTINDILLLDDFNGARLNWENSLELINISSGEKIKTFNIDIKNPSVTHLFIDDSTFILYDKNFQEYDSKGEFVRILSENEIKVFLSSENDKMIISCIHYFNNYGNCNILKSESKLLCDLLKKESLKRYHNSIVKLINKIGINCEKK